MRGSYVLRESKIFDPRDPSTAAHGSDLLDASVAKRGEEWWMVLAGQAGGSGATDLYSAMLPKGARRYLRQDGNRFGTPLDIWHPCRRVKEAPHGTAEADDIALPM